MKTFEKLIDFLFISVLVIIIFWLAIYDINPSGVRVIKHSVDHKNFLISGPIPLDRVIGTEKEDNVKYWEIGVDPIYFDLYIPRVYQKIKMIVEYKIENQDLLELGGLGASTGWQITLKPGYNKKLENLNWPCEKINKINICRNPKKELPLSKSLHIFEKSSSLERNKNSNYKFIGYRFKFDKKLDIKIDDWRDDIDLNSYDYLLTNYQSPINLENGWRRMSATFNAEELWLKGHVYKFMISAPKMNKHGGRLKIKKVSFILEKEPIGFDNIVIKLKRFIKRNFIKINFN